MRPSFQPSRFLSARALPVFCLALALAGCGSVSGPAPVEHRDLVVPSQAIAQAPISQAPTGGLVYPQAQGGGQRATQPGTFGVGQAPAVGANPRGTTQRTPGDSQLASAAPVSTNPVRTGTVTSTPLKPVDEASSNPTAQSAAAPASVPAAPSTDKPAAGAPAVVASAPSSSAQIKQPQPAAASSAAPAALTGRAADSKFIWPATGAVVQSFTQAKGMGIGISGRAGDPISAAADGKVIFSGLGPRGYGKLLIVKHTPQLLSVYAHNQNLLVKEGQAVRQGQKIAELGSTGTDRPKLHFEIRREGKPVDPLAFLPPQ